MDADRARLVERIMKLLALAAGTSFEHEAAAAKALAAELMAKHNIDSINQPKDRTIMIVGEYTPFMVGALWEYTLVKAIAKLCGCGMAWKGLEGKFNLFYIPGLTPDVEAALYILNQLRLQRIRKWIEYKNSKQPDTFGKFCFGFARGVEGKIDSIVSLAPALKTNSKAAQLWYDETYHPTPDAIHLGRASSSAGLSAGEGSNLYRGEMGSPQKRLR